MSWKSQKIFRSILKGLLILENLESENVCIFIDSWIQFLDEFKKSSESCNPTASSWRRNSSPKWIVPDYFTQYLQYSFFLFENSHVACGWSSEELSTVIEYHLIRLWHSMFNLKIREQNLFNLEYRLLKVSALIEPPSDVWSSVKYYQVCLSCVVIVALASCFIY